MAGLTQVVRSMPHTYYTFPVSGNGSNIPAGTLMITGYTAATDKGVAIPADSTAGASTHTLIGVLAEKHIYANCGDALTQTLGYWYDGFGGLVLSTAPSHKIELADTSVILSVDYAISTATAIAIASATSTVLTISTLEADLDGGFVYVNAGTGIGQLEFIKSSASNTAITVASAMGTTCDNTSTLIRVYPNFYSTPVWKVNSTTAPTLIDSTGGAGTGRAVVLGSYIVRNGLDQRLDPKGFHNTTGLNSLSSLRFYSHVQLQNTIFHPVA